MPDQVALITGCSSGIGRALAQEAARRGLIVYATARRAETLADLQGDIQALPLDVTDTDSIAAAVAAIRERDGRLDFVVNNAGQSLFGPLAEISLDRIDGLLATNVTGQIAVCQAAVPLMAAAGGGCIVNIGSVMGVVTTPFAGAYSASKAAMHLVSDCLRMELAPLGIRVVEVQPAAVQSQVADNAIDNSDLERYARDDSLYHPVHTYIERRARASQDNPMPTDEFAERVWARLLKDPPPDLIREGAGTTAFRILELLPRAMRDRMFSKRFGLDRLQP